MFLYLAYIAQLRSGIFVFHSFHRVLIIVSFSSLYSFSVEELRRDATPLEGYGTTLRHVAWIEVYTQRIRITVHVTPERGRVNILAEATLVHFWLQYAAPPGIPEIAVIL